MKELLQQIFELLSHNISVLLVGATNMGKTYFVSNSLIPFLEAQNKEVLYLENMEKDFALSENTIIILDEFEILEDMKLLEELHPEERPFYSDDYLARVKKWISRARDFPNPCVYVVTRNDRDAIENLKRIPSFSFAEDIRVIEFSRQSR